MKIAVCSNEKETYSVKQWLRHWGETAPLIMQVFTRPEQLLASYQRHTYYDLIFLTWPVKPELLRQLRQKDGQAMLVLLTDAGQNMLPAFDAGVLACLQRPLQEQAVAQTYRRCRELFLQRQRELQLIVRGPDGQREEKIFSTRDILYIESRLRKVYIHTLDQQQYECYGRISQLEAMLKANHFFRAHKSCLINLRYLCYIGVDRIALVASGGQQMVPLPLSRRRRDLLKEAVQAI